MPRCPLLSQLGTLVERPRAWLWGRRHRPFLAAVVLLAVAGGAGASVYFAVADGGGPAPTTGADWEKLEVPEFEDRYSLTADEADAGGVAPDTSFLLEAREGARLDDLGA